jgi:hypothetical protein
LSIAPVSVQVNPRQAGQSDDGWQQFAQLVRAVNAGDLPASRKAYANFAQSEAADVAQSNSDGRLARALGKVGDALQSGDIGAAQQALASIRPRAKPDGAPAAPPIVKAPGISPAAPDAPGSILNVTI